MPPGAVFLATWIAAAVYALLHLDVGWFPDTAPTELQDGSDPQLSNHAGTFS